MPGGKHLTLPHKKVEECTLNKKAECTLNKSADDIKLEGVADTLDGCASFQKYYRLEKWADRNLMKFKRRNAKSCI